MADPKENQDEIAVIEGQDGSATVDLPENMLDGIEGDGQNASQEAKNDGGSVNHDDEDHPDCRPSSHRQGHRRRSSPTRVRQDEAG